MARLLSAVTLLLLLAALAPAYTPTRAQGSTAPVLVFQTTVPGVNEIKFPDIASYERTVHVSANTNRQDANYWQKADTATTFPAPTRLGTAPGQPDYSSTAIATGPTGSVHYVWINQDNRTIYYRQRAQNGDWGPQRVVISGTPFPANPDAAIDSSGNAFVSWRDPDDNGKVRRSTNSGQSWSSTINLSNNITYNFSILAAGPNGRLAVAFTDGIDSLDRLQIFVGIWNGSSFVTRRISNGSFDFADPTVSYGPSGELYVAYRGVDTNGDGAGIFLASSQDGTEWQTSRLVNRGTTFGTANVDADDQGNLHVSWNANIDIGQRVYYAFRPVGGQFSAAVTAPNTAGLVFNGRMATTLGDRAYAHVISEMFVGTSPLLRYHLFAANAQPAIAAQPVIADNAAVVPRRDTLSVSFTGVSGNPTEVRWRWGAAPTDTANDSNNWQPFSSTLNVAPPPADPNGACSDATLYTQVRSTSATQTNAQSDAVLIDPGISAAMRASNPYVASRPSRFTSLRPADVNADGASDGDPLYTRDPLFLVQLQGLNDCSGLKDVAVGSSAVSIAPPYGLDEQYFAGVLPFPGFANPGTNTVVVRISDAAGNFSDYTRSFIYDNVAPTLSASSPGSLSAQSDPDATILADLSFSNISVSDDRYPAPGFWGVWIANSRSQIADPAADPNLRWTPVEAPGDGGSFTIEDWSLATGLATDQLTPGTYYIYVRFLDGAGNPTSGAISTTVTLTTVTRPEVFVPVTRR